MTTTIENVFYLPDQQSFEDIRSGDITRAIRAKRAGDHGSLVIESRTVEFRGTKGTVRLAPVRAVTHEGMTKVEYGEGVSFGTSYFTDWSLVKAGFGKFVSPKKKQKQLFETIERAVGALPDASADQALLQHRAETRAETARLARRRMWIGATVAIVGVLITVITYSTASSSPGGGRYFVAWGAILFGALAFFQGLAEWRRSKGG